jgi:hypothetical protein
MRFIDELNSEYASFCADLGKSVTKALAVIGQVFGEESVSPTRIV